MAIRKSATGESATRKTAGKKSSAKKTNATKSGKPSTTPPSRRWSASVKTDSTKPGPGLFKKSAKAIAEGLSKKSVSPKGPGQAMQMLSFYENRGGKNLPASRKQALEKAKDILRAKEGKAPAKKTATKSSTKKSPAKKPSAKKSATKKAGR